MTEERYYPVGHVCVEVVADVETCHRFVYDADVERLTLDLHRSYPRAHQLAGARCNGVEAVARHTILKHGPENPGNILTMARFMCLEEEEDRA